MANSDRLMELSLDARDLLETEAPFKPMQLKARLGITEDEAFNQMVIMLRDSGHLVTVSIDGEIHWVHKNNADQYQEDFE